MVVKKSGFGSSKREKEGVIFWGSRGEWCVFKGRGRRRRNGRRRRKTD